VCPGEGVRKPVASMPGVCNLSVDALVEEARSAQKLGVSTVILFGLPEKKDEAASGAWSDDGIVQRAIRALKRELRDLTVIGDVCLCEYMSHGHCGVVRTAANPLRPAGPRVVAARNVQQAIAVAAKALQPEYEIVNDATLEILAKTAVSLVRAGADVVAPSDMMDGRVAAIRKALDAARLSRVAPWTTLGQLGVELDVPVLEEIAASLTLAGVEGAKIKASLSAKAAALRAHALSDADAAAQQATERMSLPVVQMFAGFLIFIAYPALAHALGAL